MRAKGSVVLAHLVFWAWRCATTATESWPAASAGTICGYDYGDQWRHADREDRHRRIRQVEVPSGAALKRVEPGQKDLSAAATIQLSDLATGDRVLVRLDPNATGDTAQAAQIVTIKEADVARSSNRSARSGSGAGWAGW